MVGIDVGSPRERFTLPEDLLYSQSIYFHDILQPKRKPIDTEDDNDYLIYHNSLRLGVHELTFYRSTCGTNFHRSYIDEWARKRVGDGLFN